MLQESILMYGYGLISLKKQFEDERNGCTHLYHKTVGNCSRFNQEKKRNVFCLAEACPFSGE